jgi:hypothetical protein
MQSENKCKKLGVFGRNVPRKPRLEGGVKEHNIKRNYLSGKPWPVAMELQNI